MKINRLNLKNFRTFENVELLLNGRSTVIFGVNGTGKTSILNSISLLYANIINQIVNRSELRQKYNLVLDDIKFGKSQTRIESDFLIQNQVVCYYRSMIRKNGKREHDLEKLKMIASMFQEKYIDEETQDNIPIFVNYGTNRLVLDIPMRIRSKHTFDVYSAFDKAIENRIDFRTFFEWFKGQEDYENECKVQKADFNYRDKSLEVVKNAMLVMLDGYTNIRVVRKPRLEMKVEKNGMSLNVSQLSDGEKCTIALFGDLARRLAIANPKLSNPLLGEGVVLIDEVELHMHPSWQRCILEKLTSTFPNIQFIITTHSSIVLGEVDDRYNTFFINNSETSCEIRDVGRLDGYDANYILEEFMGTKSLNMKTYELIKKIYNLIDNRMYDEAETYVAELKQITNSIHPDVIRASILIRKGRLM